MPEKKSKKKYLKNLLSRNLNRWYHFSLGEYGENSDRENIFSRHLAYRCGFQLAVMKLQNHTIYCFYKGEWKLIQIFERSREGLTKIEQV